MPSIMPRAGQNRGMPAITLHQPWAQLVIDGLKVHETRNWPAPRELNGWRILIHAGAKHVHPDQLSAQLAQLVRENYAGREEPIPYGALLGSVRLVGCARTESASPASWQDRTAGDWGAGRFAWRLEDPKPFKVARPCKGAQGIWYVINENLIRED